MTKRNYRKEYDEYHASEEQKMRRQQRNKAREDAIKAGKVKRGDGKEIDHVGANRKGKLGNVTKVLPKIANRKKQPKRSGSED